MISLGGSRIVPDSVDDKFLVRFKKLIDSHPSQKFVVVTGGGSTARKYISALKKLGKGTKSQSMEGVAVTRLHAGFLARFFAPLDSKHRTGQGFVVPRNMKKVKNLLGKNHVVFCGALRWKRRNTSDGTAARLAGFLKCPFINLTNVKGLYNSDPRTNKKARHRAYPSSGGARFIPKISWDKFLKLAKSVKFEAGQHFVLDQSAARTIKKKKIVTYIVGSLGAIDSILRDGNFVGTEIRG